jgi:hypothetical protein
MLPNGTLVPTPVQPPGWDCPCGGLYSTPRDMSTFVRESRERERERERGEREERERGRGRKREKSETSLFALFVPLLTALLFIDSCQRSSEMICLREVREIRRNKRHCSFLFLL